MSIFETLLISWEDQKIWTIFSTLWNPALLEKTEFLMKIYFLKMTSEIKSQGKFFWRCQCKIQNTELVFQNSFGNIEKLTQIFKLLTWPSLALFQCFEISEILWKESKTDIKFI